MMALAIETPQLYYKMSILKRALAVSEGKLARYSHNAKISVHLRPHFDGIMIASSKEVIDLGICLHCNTKVLKLHCGDKAKKYTTTTMLNHLRTDHDIVIDNHRVKKKQNIGSDALIGSGFESFDKQLLKECKLIIKKDIAECVIRDGRPFLLPNGEGFEIMGGSFVEVGVRLGKIPNPQVLAALIPKRDATKRFISKRFAKKHARLIGYLKAKDKEILPPINFTFDLWTDAASKNEYIGVCAHEPDPVSKELKHFVLCFWEWEALNAEREASEEKNAQEEREGEEDELNEEEEEAVQRLLNEEQIQELLDSDDEEEEPVDFDENRAYDSEDNKCDHTDIDDSYLGGFDSDVNIDNDNGNGDNNEEEEEDDDDEDIDIDAPFADQEDDLSETKALKKQIRDNLEKKVIAKIQVLHHEAALLCPSLKDRRYFDGYKRGKYCQRNEAIASLKRKVQQHVRKVRQRAEEMRREILNNNDNNNVNNNDNIDLENVYLHNPLEYWYQPYVIRKYPNLQPIALKILSTPASSATVERLFSLSGFLTKGRRANLSPPAVRMLCFLKRGKYYIESDDD